MKIFIVLIMIITGFFANTSNNGDINKTEENIIQNTNAEEQILSSENTIAEKEIVNQPQVENEIEKSVEIKEQAKVESKSINNSNQTREKQEQPKVEKKQETPKEETSQTKSEPVVVEQPKTESKPKQEEKIYCVDGGKTHIYGDGANEHGYYKTWDEAFKAYEEYTKGWESTQFKIDQCACGLYYFWVIK